MVNLGLPKTGTTTLARAMRRAGMKSADHRIKPHQTEDDSLHNVFVADLLYKGFFETGDPLHHLHEFGALTEVSLLRQGRSVWPQMDFSLLRAIRTHHPDVRFLASNRDAFSLSQSMLAWSDLGASRLPNSAVPGLPQGYGETTKERMQWIEGHYATLRQIFKGDAQFMEYDIADTNIRKRLTDFLGIDVPWWGRTNRNRMSQV